MKIHLRTYSDIYHAYAARADGIDGNVFVDIFIGDDPRKGMNKEESKLFVEKYEGKSIECNSLVPFLLLAHGVKFQPEVE